MIRQLGIWALLWLGLLCISQAQTPQSRFPPGTFQSRGGIDGGGFTASCSESAAFIARETSPDATQRSRGDTLLCGLVTDGMCCAATGGVLDGLYVWATNSTTNALLNWTQNAYNATNHGALTFTAFQGYTGTANNADYLDTGFNQLTATGNFAQDSAHIGCYILSNRSTPQTWANFGASSGNDTRLVPLFGANLYLYGVNSPTGLSPGNTQAQGSWIAARANSTNAALYRNSNSTPFDTQTNSSGTRDSLNLFAFALNSGGSPAVATGDQMAACWWGAYPGSAANVVKIMDRINTYMTAYGINVY